MRAQIMALLALAACDDKGDSGIGGEGGGEEGAVQCGSTQGFVYGVVADDGGYPVDEGAIVRAVAPDGTETEAAVAAGGAFEINLEGGADYLFYAEDEGCFSVDYPLTVEECEEYELNITVAGCETADKPNLYLYPAKDTRTSVSLALSPRQEIVASDPPYSGVWRGVAHTDGTFSVKDNGSVRNQRAPFLFYEVSLAPGQSEGLQRDEGWCVPADGAVDSMAALLEEYGFNAGEVDDFVEAWRHDLPPALGYAVYPQLSVDHMADVLITPALPLERLWLLVEPDERCRIPDLPAIEPFNRVGPHAVEWGVILSGFVL